MNDRKANELCDNPLCCASITVDVRDEIKSRSVVGDFFLMRVIVAFDRKTYVGLHNKCIYTLQELQNLNDAHPNTF